MSRFDILFHQLKSQQACAFMPQLTLCDPDSTRSFDLICTLIDNGADALQLSLPFSDPLLDSPAIQAANQRALSSDGGTETSFQLIAKVRARYPAIPISLMLCANLVYAQTLDGFYQRCAEVGIDAVFIVDLPLLSREEFLPFARKYGIQQVFMCPLHTTEATLNEVATYSEGYVYLPALPHCASTDSIVKLRDLVRQLQSANSAPIMLNLETIPPQHVMEILSSGIAGMITSESVVEVIESHLDEPAMCLTKLADLAQNTKKLTALKA